MLSIFLKLIGSSQLIFSLLSLLFYLYIANAIVFIIRFKDELIVIHSLRKENTLYQLGNKTYRSIKKYKGTAISRTSIASFKTLTLDYQKELKM